MQELPPLAPQHLTPLAFTVEEASQVSRVGATNSISQSRPVPYARASSAKKPDFKGRPARLVGKPSVRFISQYWRSGKAPRKNSRHGRARRALAEAPPNRSRVKS